MYTKDNLMTTDTKTLVKKDTPRADYDNPWKNSLELYFRDFMEFCLPQIAEQINWSKGYESLDKELITITRDAKTGKRIADKLIKVWKKDGHETLILCHLEVDGKPAGKLPQRMMIYRYRIYDSRRLPIISIAILIDDNPHWRVDHYREECFGTYQEVGYIIVKLLDYQSRRQELEAMNNRFAIVILAQLTALETKHDSNTRLRTKTALTRLLFDKGFTKKDILQLFELVDWLITLPEELMVKYYEVLKQIEEERQVQFITTPERVGFQKGLEKGLQKGEATLLTRLLERRFRHIPSKYLARIQQADVNALLVWGDRMFDAKTLDEVFN
jgi:hypothetical protein